MSANTYVAKYPHYCRECAGWGLISNGRIAFGCDACINAGNCPRCRESVEHYGPCEHCGWTYADRDRGLPGSTTFPP